MALQTFEGMQHWRGTTTLAQLARGTQWGAVSSLVPWLLELAGNQSLDSMMVPLMHLISRCVLGSGLTSTGHLRPSRCAVPFHTKGDGAQWSPSVLWQSQGSSALKASACAVKRWSRNSKVPPNGKSRPWSRRFCRSSSRAASPSLPRNGQPLSSLVVTSFFSLPALVLRGNGGASSAYMYPFSLIQLIRVSSSSQSSRVALYASLRHAPARYDSDRYAWLVVRSRRTVLSVSLSSSSPTVADSCMLGGGTNSSAASRREEGDGPGDGLSLAPAELPSDASIMMPPDSHEADGRGRGKEERLATILAHTRLVWRGGRGGDALIAAPGPRRKR
mmetsp:Transcript_10481/g.25372  ORF Transcript_10481/g.25372 Transcript_10481/m.25372 type:complete len:332 (-) Transcript_10481:89-1084(-)